MPIRPENRWLYPIDWERLSATVRFKRAGSRCEHCARPHLRRIAHLGDGRWWDAEAGHWRSPCGKRTLLKGDLELSFIRTTKVVLACAHLDHDPGNSTFATSPPFANVATCYTTLPNTGRSAGGTDFGSAAFATSTRILG
jgi:hypothetical protein